MKKSDFGRQGWVGERRCDERVATGQHRLGALKAHHIEVNGI